MKRRDQLYQFLDQHFPTAEATALIEVIISIPKAVKKNRAYSTKTKRYKKINARRL